MHETNRTQGKPQVTTWILFPASVILNVFLVAIIAGHLLRRPATEPGSDSLMARAMANVEANLSAADADAFRSTIRSNAGRYSHAAADLAHARGEIEKQVAREPFDAAATKQAVSNWRDSWGHFLDDFEDTFVEALGKISPEGRHKLIEQRRKELPGIAPFK